MPGTFAFEAWDPDGPGPEATKIVAGTTFGGAPGYPTGGLAVFDPWLGTWSGLGTVNPLASITNIGPMPNGDLIVCGTFQEMSGVPANRLARFDGLAWSEVGGGVSGGGVSGQPRVILPLSSTEFIIGGTFSVAGGGPSGVGGPPVNNIARWDGTSWSTLGPGLNGAGLGLLRLPNGDILATGSFTQAGSVIVNRIARWNGTSWSAMGGGSINTVNTAAVLPDGTIIAPLNFSGSGGMARWTGSTWEPLGGGMFFQTVYELRVGPDGSLFAAGSFNQTQGSVQNSIARWNGVQWAGLGTGTNSSVVSMTMAPGNRIYLQGTFTTAGGIPAFGFARYDYGNASVTITGQPTSLTRCSGAAASFTVTASGTGPFTYQWRRNGIDVNTTTNPSAATPTLNIASVGNNTIGTYTCVVTSAGGCAAVLSNPATLSTVTGTAPTISMDPDPVAACENEPAEFFVAASGPGPLTYQWRRNGIPISVLDNPTAATNLLSIPAITQADVGTYSCVISNTCNSVTSQAAALTIVPCTAPCPADIANTDGDPIPDGTVDNGDFGLFFAAFFLPPNDPLHLLADIANTDGDTVQTGGGPDGQVDNGDFTAFFAFFFQGCP